MNTATLQKHPATVPSIKRLRVICQKEKLRKPDDLTRKHRAVSIYATWLLVRTGVTADQVTVASILTGLVAAVCLGSDGLLMGLAGVLLLYASFCLDQVDGEVARYWKKTSLRGVYLDELRHLLIYSAPIFALAFPVAAESEASWPFLAGFVAALGLTLARIESRLPALIFGERAPALVERSLLDEEKHAAKASTAVAVEAGAVAEPLPKQLARTVLEAASLTYDTLAHQVLILIWLLVAVLVDRGIGRMLGGAGLEGMLLVFLAGSTGISLLAAIFSRAKVGAVEADVRGRALATVAVARREPVALDPAGCRKECEKCGR